MKFTKNFTELNKDDASLAGGKGASLGEMIQAGISVPPGYVVLADTFEQFIKDTDLIQEIDAILNTVNHKEIHIVESASEKIQSLIKNAQISESIKEDILKQFDELNTEFVAVRSSATAEDGVDHAWAGQLDSYLNIKRENVLEKVQHCWASLFTPRAIFYRFEKELNTTKISIAVVVQKMVESEVSGIAFSVHPVTEDRNQIIIEAGFGLGEAIVSGQITPDSYVVEKNPRRIIDINVLEQSRGLFRKSDGGNEWKDLEEKGKSQVLDKKQILDLSNIILNIENHYGFPCDIEWAFEDGKFYIVQSRPITTLNERTSKENEVYFKKVLVIDTNLLFQEAATYATSEGLEQIFEVKFPFDHAPIIYFVRDGLIEFWHDEKVQEWINGQIKIILNRDKEFSLKVLESHRKNMEAFKEIISNDFIKSKIELLNFYKKLKDWMIYYGLFYFIMPDESMSQNLKNEFEEVRGNDTFGEVADNFLRKSVGFIYPELIGYENLIIENDIVNEINYEKVKQRKLSYSLYFNKNITYEEAKSYRSDFRFIEESKITNSDITGQIGYKGKTTGNVRIILKKEDFSKFEEGEILVTHMTTPDFISILKKASAFVTDFGGVMSHAAIISRELKIPCIIGTKIATQVFKDGDFIEVDANNGVVRIVK